MYRGWKRQTRVKNVLYTDLSLITDTRTTVSPSEDLVRVGSLGTGLSPQDPPGGGRGNERKVYTTLGPFRCVTYFVSPGVQETPRTPEDRN